MAQANEAVPILAPSRPFRFHYPYRQSIAISFFNPLAPPHLDIQIFHDDIRKFEMPNLTIHRVTSNVPGNSNLLVYFKDAGTYEDDPSESLSVVMLRRPHTEAITWFSSSSSLNGLLFHLEQKALISAPAYISPEENAPHVNDDAVPYYLSWKHTDLHTRLCLLLRHCFPPQLLQSGPEDGQEDHNASLGDDSKDGRDVDTPDDNQAPAEQDKAVAPDGFGNKDTDRQSEVDASGDEHINEEQVEITADNQAPAADDKAAAPSETDNGDDQPEAPTVTLNPAIPPDYAARLAPLRPANVRDYTRLQDNLSDTVDPGEQILASFNHCKSLEDYRRDKQAFLAAARGEKKTVEEWRVWAVNGGGFGGRNCRDGRARQWAKTFHAMGWVELKEE